MKGNLLQPVVFNIITIVAMLYALGQLIFEGPQLLTSTTGLIVMLDELAEESDLVDENVVSSFTADQEQRSALFNNVIVVMVIAIVANVVANYLGGEGITRICLGFENLRRNCAGCERISASGPLR